MEQNKFEKNIKEVLEKRTIDPSVQAWNKLEAKLDSMPTSNNFSPYYWIAASVIFLITISILVFNSPSQEVQHVVEINEENKVMQNDVVIKPEPVIKNQEVLVVETDEKEKLVVEKPDMINTNKKVLVNNKTIENKLKRKEVQALTFEEQNVNEVVKKIQIIQLRKEITEEEIDLLLAQAQREIDSQKMLNKTTDKVDAMALLTDVESELDKSFKDKVLDILKDKVIQVVESKEN